MLVLSWGVIFFSSSFFLHIVIWRIKIPKRQIKILVLIFFGVLGLGQVFLLVGSNYFEYISEISPDRIIDYFHISLFVTSLTLSYVITYSALEVDSPSLVMIKSIDDAGPEGLTNDDFIKAMSNDILVIPRVKDLVRDKMIYMNGEKYLLTQKGRWFILVFIYYRRLMNAQGKGG